MEPSNRSDEDKDMLETTFLPPPNTTSRILFGSCHSQHYYNNNNDSVLPIWDTMSTRNASAMVWVGDAIYGDDFIHVSSPSPTVTNTTKWMTKLLSPSRRKIIRPATPSILQELYNELIANPGYRRLTRRTTDSTAATNNNHHPMTVLGVWDDHDYGINNGDYRYMYRTESAKLYLQFLQQSSRTPTLDLRYMEQRANAGRGLYGVKVFDFYQSWGQELLSDDDAGIEWEDGTATAAVHDTPPPQPLSDRSVAIFLIDCRSNKTPWNHMYHPLWSPHHRFRQNYEADFLGPEQWQWLERSLRRSTAAVNIIVQGLQVHADHLYVFYEF